MVWAPFRREVVVMPYPSTDRDAHDLRSRNALQENLVQISIVAGEERRFSDGPERFLPHPGQAGENHRVNRLGCGPEYSRASRCPHPWGAPLARSSLA